MTEFTELNERFSTLETALYDQHGWQLLLDAARDEFSRTGLAVITELARVLAVKNPLIRRGVSVKRDYVWAQGCTIRATHPTVNAIVQAFLADPDNRLELFGHDARLQKEKELQTDGNLFLVLFPHAGPGTIKLRSIPFSEIADIITDPEDRQRPWFYRRTWTRIITDLTTGQTTTENRTEYYPDWRYHPAFMPSTIGSDQIHWQSPIYHIKTGAYSDWPFGLSEIYAAADWAVAHKEQLEDWATIIRAYSRFAFDLSLKGGAAAAATAKTKLNATAANPATGAPLVGSTFIHAEGTKLEPIRTNGATTSPDDSRQLKLQVAAALDLPEPMFGDAKQGTYATAKVLDRPTELAALSRQRFWTEVYQDLLAYVCLTNAAQPRSPLRSLTTMAANVRTWRNPADGNLEITFPPIVAPDIASTVGAIMTAAPVLEDNVIHRLLHAALSVPDDHASHDHHPPRHTDHAADHVQEAAGDPPAGGGDSGAGTFEDDLTTLIAAADYLTEDELAEQIYELTAAAYLRAFLAGAMLAEALLTTDQVNILDDMRSAVRKAAQGLAHAVKTNASNLAARIKIWVSRWHEWWQRGKTEIRDDPLLTWRYDPMKEHCVTCLNLHGTTKRASEWRASGFWPGARTLACGGWLCGCHLEPTL